MERLFTSSSFRGVVSIIDINFLVHSRGLVWEKADIQLTYRLTTIEAKEPRVPCFTELSAISLACNSLPIISIRCLDAEN